ncbi:hypothetical protein [Kitasatospora acidiphila]|uniref:hypothetical protein n=1 Tax=Kitasatospora acidiphila TaxID=2567942 RepID=UPI0015F08282|nr:hypothetical protein [Kitasatospora acidiphila]
MSSTTATCLEHEDEDEDDGMMRPFTVLPGAVMDLLASTPKRDVVNGPSGSAH